MRGDTVQFDGQTVNSPGLKKFLLIGIIIGIICFIIASCGVVYISATRPEPTPVFTIIPTILPTPAPTPIATPTPEPIITPTLPETGDYPDATGQKYLYDVTNNTYTITNKTPTPAPVPATIEMARLLGWTPDLGFSVEEYIEEYNLANGLIKPKPDLSLEILDTNKIPFDWQREVLEPGQIVAGYYKINNRADYPYQGDIDVYVNASIYYNNNYVHIENLLRTVFVSIAPRNFMMPGEPIYWQIPEELSTGVYELVIEIREKDYGTTVARSRITPTIAHIDENGLKYF